MTETYTPEKVAELVAEAREWPRDGVNEGPLINALADALEAAHMHVETIGDFLQAEIAESDRMESECVEHRARHVEWVAKVEAERDEALAVIAEALDWRDEACHGAFGKGEFAQGYRYARRAIGRILSRIPEHPKED